MITRNEINNIAKLARISLTGEEMDALSKDLENILSYITQLETLNVADIPPTSHVLALENVYRKDTAAPSLDREKALSIATLKLNGFFKVPQIIE